MVILHFTHHQLMDLGIISTFLNILSRTAINVCVQDFVWTFSFWGCTSRIEFLGHMVTLMLNHLRIARTILQSSCPVLHSHQQPMRVAISSHPCQHIIICLFFNHSHPSGYEVVFHCEFLAAS